MQQLNNYMEHYHHDGGIRVGHVAIGSYQAQSSKVKCNNLTTMWSIVIMMATLELVMLPSVLIKLNLQMQQPNNYVEHCHHDAWDGERKPPIMAL